MKPGQQNSTDCWYLDKMGVTICSPADKLYRIEGDWITNAKMCTVHCPFPECVLYHPEWKKVNLRPEWLLEWEKENE